ncbi:hypothetical protein FRC0485_02059 [Corynebacterium diphtheriae]|nr:hypothetical protein FRC0485_02059 [Corynebacterium diphtheriae]
MFSLYVDESYKRDHYYVAGVLVDKKQDANLIYRLEELASGLQGVMGGRPLRNFTGTHS